MSKNEEKEFTVTVDGDEVQVPRKDLTPRMLLELVGLDPSERYIIAQLGNNPVSYKDKPDEFIKGLHQNMVFLTGSLAAVTVS